MTVPSPLIELTIPTGQGPHAELYSDRNASIGCTRAARSAGVRLAGAATPTRATGAAMNVAGSVAETP